MRFRHHMRNANCYVACPVTLAAKGTFAAACLALAVSSLAAASSASAAARPTVTGTTAAPVPGTMSGDRAACVDTPLTITFPSAPSLGTTGSITVHNADGSVADSIDLADPASFTETVGGATDEARDLHYFRYYPVIVTGDTATVYLHHELDYGRTYYVTVDPGVFAGFGGISSPDAWRFTTRPRAPRPGARVRWRT